MSRPVDIRFDPADADPKEVTGILAVFAAPDGKLGRGARRVNTAARKAVERFLASDAFETLDEGAAARIDWPGGLSARAVMVVKLGAKADAATARRAGAALGKVLGEDGLTIIADGVKRVEDVALGLALRAYDFDSHKSKKAETRGRVRMICADPEAAAKAARDGMALAEGVFFTRDLINEPANVLTTDDFAARLAAMQDLGLDVEILEEDALEELGMGALLSVGQGSASPSKVVVMRWNGAGDEAPLALVGKGVVFDTGGISLKPAAGMEEMTMDMGGAGVVCGTMRALALRKAKANVVGLVGLVENMPSGTATRPGDVVRSMKGDTIEVVNTDAEGRLVLADVLHYAQERFAPAAIVDLATLTGAIVVALGAENAGVFSNDDNFAGDLLKAAEAEGEGAWRMPLGRAYAKLIESRVADVKNSGGRPAGSITAAEFLRRFVRDSTPWCHIDIAGVASRKDGTALSPGGATGWGVLTLNRLVKDRFEV